jgi:protein-tyrosine phosphatase
MAQLLDWQEKEDRSGLIRTVIDALGRGRLVGLPTETVYGVAASSSVPEGVARLQRGKGRPEQKPLTLALASPEEAFRWVPAMSAVGRRLAKRCWPGPLTLVFRAGFTGGPYDRLPEPVQRRVCPGDTLGLRVPDHPAALQILAQVDAPLVLSSANRSGELPACTATAIAEELGDDVEVVIDGGPCRYGMPSTVVLVEGNGWKILRTGVLTQKELSEQAACRILFICTGNTCRSPMAAALCKKILARRFNCHVLDLPEKGFIVQSAGLTAMIGNEAAPEAVEAAKAREADFVDHRTQPVTQDLLERADQVVVMTRLHLLSLEEWFPAVGPTPQLLCIDGEDLSDPIGCAQQVYHECARKIEANLEHLVARWIDQDRMWRAERSRRV